MKSERFSMDFEVWRKSSRSQGTQGDCVEVAHAPGAVGLRDSKNPHGDHLTLPATEWPALLAELRIAR